MHPRLKLISAVLLVLTVAPATNFGVSQAGQTIPPCRIGERAAPIGFWTWPQGTRVKVYIRSADFASRQIPYLVSALTNWNEVSDATTSGVTFEYVGETAQTLDCVNCMTITRGQVFDGKRRHLTELHAYSVKHNQLIT